MPVVSTRPGIKIRVPVKFPARVTVQSPLILTQTGANYDFSLNVAAITGGGITVWQLRVALKAAGNFYAVDTAITVDPGERIYEAWNTGGLRTAVNDDLYNTLVSIIGAPAAAAAYANAAAITL